MRTAQRSSQRVQPRRRLRRAVATGSAAVTTLVLLGTWNAGAAPAPVLGSGLGPGSGASGARVPRAAADPAASAGPLWEADPGRGTGVFEGVEKEPGEVGVVDDPAGRYGKTYRLHTSGRKTDSGKRVRVETRGHRTPGGDTLRFTEGDTVYIGWRSRWSPLPTAERNWVTLWQLKDYGEGASTPPLSLRARGDGTLGLDYAGPSGKSAEVWGTELRTDKWYEFTVGLTVSDDPAKGRVKLWLDGVRQHLKGGDTFKGATLRADWVTDKWGVYRSDGVKGPATAYLNSARVGSRYADAAP